MSKSPETYRRLIDGKTSLQIAELTLADLIGYRRTSVKRADDIDTLVAIIEAIRSYGI